jgi:hypothetical protein
VVHQDPHAALGSGPEVAQVLRQVVDPLEVLHDHALDPQVVTPDLLHQLRVMPSLDEDPAGAGDPGGGAGNGHGPRCGPRLRGRAAACWRRQDDGCSLEQEAGPEWKGASPSAPVLQGDGPEVAFDGDDLAAPVGRHLLDDEAAVRLDLHRAASSGSPPVGVQDVRAVSVVREVRRVRHPRTVGVAVVRAPSGTRDPGPISPWLQAWGDISSDYRRTVAQGGTP